MCEKCVKICPRKVLEKNDGKIRIINLLNCTLCKNCVEICEKNPSAIQINWKEDSIIFEIETTGSLPVEELIKEALKVYEKKYSNLLEQFMVFENDSS